MNPSPIRVGRMLGKYRLLSRIGSGGFAQVFRALDTVEGIRVALKIPHAHLAEKAVLGDFRREIRLVASLDHPHVLPVKSAEWIDGRLVVASPLGEETMADRLQRRMATGTCLALGEQLLEALAYAHARRIMHCDVKPENLILFPGPLLKLADFGIAKLSLRTLSASGSGTVGYVAPEQALGRPSPRSDVFSAGLILYRMLAGELPAWPFEWPPPGAARLRRKVPREFREFLRRAIRVDSRQRFPDAVRMLAACRRLLPGVQRYLRGARRRRRTTADRPADWREVRHREFARRYRTALGLRHACGRCGGPVSEAMFACPWCGTGRKRHRGPTAFPARCSRCGRGRKLDWRCCGWCYGPSFRKVSARAYGDRRYTARCANPRCPRGELMPFLRYCPWCRTKVRRTWRIPGVRGSCPRCHWGVAAAYWEYCPWCGASLKACR